MKISSLNRAPEVVSLNRKKNRRNGEDDEDLY